MGKRLSRVLKGKAKAEMTETNEQDQASNVPMNDKIQQSPATRDNMETGAEETKRADGDEQAVVAQPGGGNAGQVQKAAKKPHPIMTKEALTSSNLNLKQEQNFKTDIGINRNAAIKNATYAKKSHTGSGHGQNSQK